MRFPARRLPVAATLFLTAAAARAGNVPPVPPGATATTTTFASDIVPVPILDNQSNPST